MIPGRRILVLGYAAIGDLIFFLPVLEALRARWPKAKITFVANPYPTTRELLPATGLVDEIVLIDWEARRSRGTAPLKAECFDWAVLTLSAPAHYFRSVLSNIPVVAGHHRTLEGTWPQKLKRGIVTGEFARRLLVNHVAAPPTTGEHALHRNLRLLDALEIPHAPAPRPKLPVGSFSRDSFVAVHLGAPNNQYRKMWAPERFRELLSRFPGTEFVLLGGREERSVARGFGSNVTNLTGELGLLDTFAALKKAKLLISNDTGLAKAAMALGTPTVTLWGPSDPKEYGTIWEPEKHVDVKASDLCGPRTFMGMARPGVKPACGHENCLEALTVDRVEAAVRSKLV